VIDCVLWAAVGPNPASVSEAIWALYRQRGWRVVALDVVALDEGHFYLHDELLDAGRALDQLRDVLAIDVDVRETVTRRDDGAIVEADVVFDDAATYRAAVWQSAKACVERAGARPVVFLLAGGRARSTTAYAALAYQLLARPGDRLIDVRVTDRRAEGGSGFFFPEQAQRVIPVRGGGMLDVTTVGVILVDVAAPRLADLVGAGARGSIDDAVAASDRVVEALRPPRLRVDLAIGEIAIEGVAVPFSAAEAAWYAALAAHRRAWPEREGLGADGADVGELLGGVAARPWAEKIRDRTMRGLLGMTGKTGKPIVVDDPADDLRKLRTDTKRRVATFVASRNWDRWAPLVVPRAGKRAHRGYSWIDLDPAFIEIVAAN
jgi:CRISPR-associated protein (TIGR02584 family)